MWWKSIEASYVNAPCSWEKFVLVFKLKYVPQPYLKALHNEFFNQKQGTMTVMEYITKFDDLSRYAPVLVATPEARRERFFDGLTYGIRDKMVSPRSYHLISLSVWHLSMREITLSIGLP